MIRARRSLFALFVLMAMVLAACGSSGGSKSSGGSTGGTGGSTGGTVPNGGTLVLGAEQEMDCADWIASCAGSSWGVYTMEEHTMPRVFDYEKKNGLWTEVPNVLVTKMPEVTEVGGKQTVTYDINPKAVWSDGQPITSTDFKYTWDQIVNGSDIYDTSGYSQIASVDDSNPQQAVVTFSSPYASWKGLFGGGLYGIFPSHLLQGKDRDAEMKDGYSWSGGPWLAKWNKGSNVTLTPNPKWYGTKVHLDKVIFKFLADTAAEFKAFESGEVLAIYPQPQPDAIAAIKGGVSGTNSFFTADTGNSEALWLNNAKPPLDSVKVRQAIGYAIDRDAMIKRLFGALGVSKASQSLNYPIIKRYADDAAYAVYKPNPTKVKDLLEGEGYKKGSDGFWAKDGKRLTLEMRTTAGNKRRELTEQILHEQLKSAGIELTIANQSAADLFGTSLPNGDYQIGLYAQTATSLDPGLCSIACSDNIPTDANGNVGQNWQRINVPGLDEQLKTVDSSIDDSARIAASKKADQLMGENQVSLPFDPMPNILLWSKKIVGPVHDDPIFSMFINLDKWGVKK
ncbi:MAG: ABC transporter family substrate-binding protein [Acidimicrobiia bacterium]